MKKLMTLCEPYWTGDSLDNIWPKGYWSIKVICECTPNFLEKLIGKKPYTVEHTYTNLYNHATAINWRNSNGDEVESFGVFTVAPGEQLRDHLEKHLTAKTMEKIQKQVIKE
jgi:hypothetical protein